MVRSDCISDCIGVQNQCDTRRSAHSLRVGRLPFLTRLCRKAGHETPWRTVNPGPLGFALAYCADPTTVWFLSRPRIFLRFPQSGMRTAARVILSGAASPSAFSTSAARISSWISGASGSLVIVCVTRPLVAQQRRAKSATSCFRLS